MHARTGESQRDAADFRPLRIAFIGARGIGSAYSGIETYYEEVGARLVSYGHEVLAYCRRHATPPGTDFRGVTPVFRPCIRSKHGETFSHTLVSTLDVLFRHADIVQFHALGPSLFSGIPRVTRAKTVASIRGLDWQREKWGPFATKFLQFCEAQSYLRPNAVSVVSRTLAEHYRDAYGAQVTFIPNGVTLEASPPPQEIHALGLAGKDYFLFMGRLSPEKGLDVLLEAYRPLAQRAKLVIAGGGSYTDDFQTKLRASAPEGVVFPGRVGGRLRAELYANALAFMLPSTIEGLSVALLEAMGHGAFPITSDIPNNRELADGVGLCVPVGDVRALREALAWVLEHPAEAEARGQRAKALVEAEYTWDQVARRTEQFYYAVLDGTAPGCR
jgi:glycosyltransferase involved in cell wall biosynthesis